MGRKQLIALVLAAVVSVGGVVAQGVIQKPSAVDEPVRKYFDPEAGIPCQDCVEEEEQTCQTNVTDFPCMCEATAGSQSGNLVQAHLENVASESCVALYRSIQ
ncbi:hypothetical protein [Parapedobacter soli]|uniref:hypothetical protein n=1 Tax=Parapedobacter soli TaxID=416955 RepID=UPI0021C5CF29|nr:hypothetical protein [Parapedobacter soli]